MTTLTTASTVEKLPTAERPSLWLTISRNYFVRKLLKTLLTIFAVTTFIFFLIRLLPGNPIEVYVNQLVIQQGMPIEQARTQAASLFAIDLNESIFTQYMRFLTNLVRGDFGLSIMSPGTSVSSIITKYLPWTIFWVGTALIVSFILGILLGLLMALRRDSFLDHALTIFASIMSAIPSYIIAILLVVWMGVQWKLVSIAKMRGILSPGVQPGLNVRFFADIFYHASLPIFTYIIATVGGWMLSMKSSTLGTLGEDYVTVAKARGLTDWRITTAYVGRNAALPLFTQLAISIGFVVGGAFLIESIFQYTGIGSILVGSIGKRDYTVMQGVFLIITLSVVLANFFADMLYSWLDPRIRSES
ncbi:MAG: ABC transporter permease [Caldilineaceae bacterium]